MGSGHIVHGHGVAHQLRDLGVSRLASFLPWGRSDDCKTLSPGLATAVFALPAARPGPSRPLLGITVEAVPEGVRISAVQPNSLAEGAGLLAGDVLIEVAGTVVKDASQVRPIVQSVAPGTWLPIKLMRQGEQREVVARFPRAGR
jgi:S1-C subfamily serine protease